MKISSIDFDLKNIEEKKIFYKDLGLTEIRLESFSNGEDIWILANNNENQFYLKLNDSGLPIQKIALDKIGGSPKRFIISPQGQIQIIDNNLLRITKERPVSITGNK